MAASLYLILTSIIFPILAICWLCCIACCIYRSLLKNLRRPGRTTKVQIVVSDRRDSNSSHLPNTNNGASNGRRQGDSGRSLFNSSRILHWHMGSSNGNSRTSSRRNSSVPPPVEHMNPVVPPGIPDIDVESAALQQSHSSSYGPANSSMGSMSLSQAIKEARRQNEESQNNKKQKKLNGSSGTSTTTTSANCDNSQGPIYYPRYPQSMASPTQKDASPMAPLHPPWPKLPPLPNNASKDRPTSPLPTSVRSFLNAQRWTNNLKYDIKLIAT